MFKQLVARDPFDRSPTNGLRCASYSEAPVPGVARSGGPVWDVREESAGGPRGLRRPIAGCMTTTGGRSRPSWKSGRQLATTGARDVFVRRAYGNVRVRAFVSCRRAVPPYQAVVWFPGDDVFVFPSSERLASSYLFDFIPRSGRALVYPVHQGMYERARLLSFAAPTNGAT